MKLFLRIVLLASLCVPGSISTLAKDSVATTFVVKGLDHIPLAVRDLESAAESYRKLGFILKPGTVHADGIRNQHIKFPNRTEIELITAPEARDTLTTEYRQLLAAGEGAAFLGLYAPDANLLTKRLDQAAQPYQREGGMIVFDIQNSLHPFFFGSRSPSPTDRPEYFQHPNTAESLIGVWLAGDDFSSEHHLLKALGVPIRKERACTPQCQRAEIAHLPDGEVVFLPSSRQLIPGRRIVGATIQVRSLATAQQILEGNKLKISPSIKSSTGSSIFLPPEITHGIWLEFRQKR